MPNWTIALKDARWPRVFRAMWSVAGQAKKRLRGHWRALERERASPVSVSCAAFAFVLACATAHADVKDGVAAYRRHDYAAALREFQEAGRHDDMHALNYLGIMYAEGLGTPRDDETAAAYFYKASVLGYPEAMANMGRMHELGLGVKRDYQTAISEYRAAANAGFKPAIMRMVEIFEKGELGLAPNAALADEWRARMRTSAPRVNSIEAVTVTRAKARHLDQGSDGRAAAYAADQLCYRQSRAHCLRFLGYGEPPRDVGTRGRRRWIEPAQGGAGGRPDAYRRQSQTA